MANFGKSIVKEALGVRRELSLVNDLRPSSLTLAGVLPAVDVAANPPSEFWLAFIDPAGLEYAESPNAFGIKLVHFAV